MRKAIAWAAASAGFALAAFSGAASAQDYPTKTVTVVVFTAAGGVQSALARLIGQQLEKKWGQSMVVDNRPGAGGLIGAELVNRAAPDGYTLLLGSDAISTFPIFMKATKFDTERDLTPISIAASSPFILQINSKVPAKNYQEFIAYAKANPGKLNQAIVGASQQMLDAITFEQKAGVDIPIIPYAGGSPSITALLANDVQLYFGSYQVSAPHFKAGTLIPIAILGDKRHRNLPDVPTVKELGTDLSGGFWFGYFAPPGTPRPLRDKISNDVREVLKRPDITAQVQDTLGMDVVASTVDEMAARMALEVKSRQAAAKAAKIEPK
jgi:tripartite-type tricarboxylate transporter receptor subunit TctC